MTGSPVIPPAAEGPALWPEPEAARGRRPVRVWLIALAVIAVAQTAVLGWLLWDRISILRAPTAITLIPEPVDPRDLFRGDYVILSYGVSQIPEGIREALDPAQGDPVWVRLSPPTASGEADAIAEWTVAAVAPSRAAVAGEGPILRAVVDRGGWGLAYGLERYYVPEGEGLALEERIGDRAIAVTVAIDDDGRSAIKGLTVDGETVFEEPWF